MKVIQLSTNTYCLSLREGEKMVESIKQFHSIYGNNKFCSVSGIGAIGEVTLAIAYRTEAGLVDYRFLTSKQDYEVVSLLGNISMKNDKTMVHLHIALADKESHVIGGHLDEAVINVLGEIIITVYDVEVMRSYDDSIGLQVL